MMEESNDIFLADGDSVYFAEPVHKKYSKTFNWAIHLVSTCFIANFSSPLSPSTHLYMFWMTHSPFPQLRTYFMDGLFLNQKANNI